MLVDLNGRAYNLPGDIILAGVQISAPLIDFCHGITHLQLMIELGYGIKPQSHRAHRGRTDGDDYLSRKQLVGFLRLDGKEC